MNSPEAPSTYQLYEMFIEDRKTMAEYNSDSETMAKYAIEEILEFGEAFKHYIEEPTEENLNHVCAEASHVKFCLNQVVKNEGRDPEQEEREALGMMQAQYPAAYFNNGLSYTEARYKSKLEVKTMGLKDIFYGGKTIDGKTGIIYQTPTSQKSENE